MQGVRPSVQKDFKRQIPLYGTERKRERERERERKKEIKSTVHINPFVYVKVILRKLTYDMGAASNKMSCVLLTKC
jgi:hypothetical protein